ncbi:MAG: DUF3341 domain-containing protein [Candidatus Eisenbacteria bacterium]|uniref:DUF3341 domain-containing protein n=1 Tax=Eiseniibacteriota bacterium TaxID=2212470 RepID=A0A956N9B6_UNCEI|nr:DUF3341 domain-containing protein [Candidatus Eisenbacteria bacterium]MCB9464925.1 DUF3341 domain-containing protein [Candidatus Eisenbacteria bacterium]
MSVAENRVATDKPSFFGYLVEFDNVDSLIHAAEKVRDAGYTNWDAHTPFPVHGMDRAMGIRYTKLPLVILGGGLTGLGGALLMQWWMNAVNYPYIISGKPFWSIPANIPVMFELTVLFSALTTVFGMLAFNKLPQWRHGVFSSARFARATDDRFFISVEATDPKFDAKKTADFLAGLGGSEVEALED